MNTTPTHEALIALAGGSIHEHRKATRKMRWWYEALADYMITHPTATQGEMATYFGRAESTLSTVINTDAFKAYFRQRRAQHAEKLDSSVREKLFRVADSSLDRMLDVLDKKRDSIPLETLHKTTDTALKNLGYGAGAPGVNVNVSAPPTTVNVAVSLDDLERARAALRRNQMSVPLVESPAEAGAAPYETPRSSPPIIDNESAPEGAQREPEPSGSASEDQ